MTRFVRTMLAALIGLAAGTAGAPGFAADRSMYGDDVSACGEARVLHKITSRFRHQVRNVPHLPDVEIADFQRIHQHRYLPAREHRPIGRRYCGANVVLSDGRTRTIWYLIEEGMGFASIGDNVEFCVSGFDRWMVYNGRCRILR